MTLKYWVWFSGLCMCIGKRLGVIDLWFWRIKAWDIYQLKIYQNLAPFSPTWRLTQFDKFRLFKIYESRLKRLKTLKNLSKLKNFALCWWQVAQCDAWGIFLWFWAHLIEKTKLGQRIKNNIVSTFALGNALIDKTYSKSEV